MVDWFARVSTWAALKLLRRNTYRLLLKYGSVSVSKEWGAKDPGFPPSGTLGQLRRNTFIDFCQRVLTEKNQQKTLKRGKNVVLLQKWKIQYWCALNLPPAKFVFFRLLSYCTERHCILHLSGWCISVIADCYYSRDLQDFASRLLWSSRFQLMSYSMTRLYRR